MNLFSYECRLFGKRLAQIHGIIWRQLKNSRFTEVHPRIQKLMPLPPTESSQMDQFPKRTIESLLNWNPACKASPTPVFQALLLLGLFAASAYETRGQEFGLKWTLDFANGTTQPTLDQDGVVYVADQGPVTLALAAATEGECTNVVPTSPICDPTPEGLVGWFPLDQDAANQADAPTSGGSSTATFGPGYVRGAAFFDGLSPGFILPTDPILQSQSFTVETWIQRASTTASSRAFPADGAIYSGGTLSYGMAIRADGTLFLGHIGVEGGYYFSSGQINDLGWHHVAITKSGGSIAFYLDGNPAGNADLGDLQFDLTTPFAIGSLGVPFRGINYAFWGGVDELSVYNRPLSSEEIRSIWARRSAGKCPGGFGLNGSAVFNDGLIVSSDPRTFAYRDGSPILWSKDFSGTCIVGDQGLVFVSGSSLAALDGASGRVRWDLPQVPRGGLVLGTSGFLFHAKDSRIRAIDSYAGVPLWERHLDFAVVGSPAVGRDQNVYVAGNSGFGGALVALSGRDGSHLWETTIPVHATSGPTISADGTILFRSETEVITLNSSSGGLARSPWPMEAQNPRCTRNQADGEFQDYVPGGSVAEERREFVVGQTVEVPGLITGGPVTGIQWFRDGLVLAGRTNLLLAFDSVALGDIGRYDFVLQAAHGTNRSSPVDLVVAGTPRVLVEDREIVGQKVFREPLAVALQSSFPNGRIFFTLDGAEPTSESSLYTGLLVVSNDVVVRSFALSSDFSKTATNRPVRLIRGFHIQGSVVGEGDVDGLGNGIFELGSVVKLRAVAHRGWRFVRWSGGAVGTEQEINLTVTGDSTVEAVFEELERYSLTAEVEGLGRVERTPVRERYLPGDKAFVKAIPNAGWRFLRWEGDASSPTEVAEVLLSANRAVRAVFEPIPRYTITTQAPAGVGQVTGGGEYFEGTEIEVKALPQAGWRFLGWAGDYAGAGESFRWTVTSPATFSALFGTAVSVSSTGGGRIVLEPDLPVFEHGSRVKVLPVPDEGQYLAVWSELWSTQPKTGWTLIVTNPQPTIGALFSALPAGTVPLRINSVGGGEVVGVPSKMAFALGESVTLKATPWPGFLFSGWSGDAAGSSPTVALVMDRARQVIATFVEASVGNTTPVFVPVSNQVVDEGAALELTLLANDADFPAQGLRFALVAGPTGMTVTPAGVLSWLPVESQGPSTNTVTVRVTDNGVPPRTATRQFEVVVQEVNRAPSVTTLGDQQIAEGQEWVRLLTALDSDIPPQRLTYGLVSGPSGLVVNAVGAVTWTPAEDQGPSVNTITVQVSDDGTPPLSTVMSFTVNVTESASVPVITTPGSQTVDEGQTLTLTLEATDTDLPAQALSFSLVNGPAGLTVSPTGVLSWTPTEAQGPSTNLVTVRVSDDGLNPLSSTADFVIVVREVSSPPVLASVENQSVDEGQSLALTLTASDSDLPAQALSYGLVSGPAGMTVATNGVLAWTPGESHGGSSHSVTVQVSDDGNPSLASTTTFEVAVREVNSPPTLASVGPQSVIEGQLLSVTLLGTDTDLPAQSLGYRLVSGPAGLTVSAAGALSWIPTAAQSPGVYPVTVQVADDAEPSQVAVAEFEISVSEAPNLALRRVWQIGTDDDSDVLPYLPNGEFSRENERNDPPPGQVTLRPEDPEYVAGANPPADDDFYFAGLYAAGFNGLTADRTVTYDEPPVAWEWAQTLQDRTNRVHFVLEPDHVAADATFRLSVEFPRGGSSVAGVVIPGFGTHPLEFRLRNSLGAESLLGSVLISGPTNIEFNFPASAVGATVGANTVEIVRTDVLPSNTGAWVFYDFLRLESFPPGSAPPMITQRPQGVTAGFGEAVVLSVKADSAVPPTYQWFRNKRAILGATGASYLIPSLGVGDVGDYFVVVTNPNGSASSFPDNDVRVMLRGAFVIEAEDYNFGGGQTVDAASVMPLVSGLYEGKDGLQSIDFSIVEDTSDSAAGGNNLRNGWTNNGVVIPAVPGANADVTLDNEGGNAVRPDFVLTTNYKLGWSNPGEWFQYTRTFPPGRYSAVFVGAREGRAVDVMGRTLELVTGDGSQADAATTVIGELLANGTGGWSSHDWLPFLVPAVGAIAEFDLSGRQTLRLRHSVGDGDDDALLLYRLPSSVNLPPLLASIGDQFLDEGQTLSLSLVGSDSDLPVQELTYGLVSGPAGLTVSPTGVVSWTPTESQGPLIHTVLVQVTDSAEPPLSATSRFEVTVREVNQAPLLAAPETQSVKEGEALQLILFGSDGDLPAQVLTYALVSGPSGLSVTEAGLVVWAPTETQGPSTNSVTVRVVDNGDPRLSATATFTVIVQEGNTAPTLASPATPTLEEGQALNLVLSGNDSDLPAQALTYALESGPAGLTVSPAGVVSWIPTELQGGSTNEVTVRTTDNGEPPLFVRTTFSVIVREVNQAPVLTTPGDQDIAEGTALDLTLRGQDADLPAQVLTFGLISGPPGVVVSPSGALNWVPTESQGPSTNLVTVVVNDQGSPALSGTVSFTVVVREVNQAPQFPTLLEQTVNEGQGFALQLVGSDPDLPPQSLTYSLVAGPSGLTVGLNGLVNWAPSESQGPSTNDVTVRVSDNGVPPIATTNTLRVIVREVNTPPTMVAPANQILDEGQVFTWDLQGTDGDLPLQLLSYALIQAPLGMEVTPQGVVTWTPNEPQGPSTNEVTIRLSDAGTPVLATTINFQLVVRENNRAPVWQNIPEQSVGEEQTLTLPLAAGDPDLPYQTLTYSLLSGPPGLTIAAPGELTWTPSESQGGSTNAVTIRVADNGEPPLSATNELRIVVREINRAPVLPHVTKQTIVASVPWSFALAGTDADLPAQLLSYSVLSGPLGLSVTPSGEVTWTPSDAQAPSTNTITLRLSDDGQPPLATTADFVVVVRPRDEIPELTLSVPETGGPMVLKIRGKNGQALILENAPILGQWSEAQRLTGLGMDTPVQVVLPAILPDQIQFWRVRTNP